MSIEPSNSSRAMDDILELVVQQACNYCINVIYDLTNYPSVYFIFFKEYGSSRKSNQILSRSVVSMNDLLSTFIDWWPPSDYESKLYKHRCSLPRVWQLNMARWTISLRTTRKQRIFITHTLSRKQIFPHSPIIVYIQVTIMRQLCTYI